MTRLGNRRYNVVQCSLNLVTYRATHKSETYALILTRDSNCSRSLVRVLAAQMKRYVFPYVTTAEAAGSGK